MTQPGKEPATISMMIEYANHYATQSYCTSKYKFVLLS